MRGRTSLAPLLVTSALCGASAFASVLRPSLQAFSRLRVGTSHYSANSHRIPAANFHTSLRLSGGSSLESEFSEAAAKVMDKNVLGSALQCCCTEPKTGFYRDGFCCTGPQDFGRHVVCARVTKDFLEFSKSKGNNLMTPAPQFSFPGLKPGDKWCLCASRWKEAFDAGVAPPVILEACHEKSLEYGISINDLKAHEFKGA